jgi:DUF971 family protein
MKLKNLEVVEVVAFGKVVGSIVRDEVFITGSYGWSYISDSGHVSGAAKTYEDALQAIADQMLAAIEESTASYAANCKGA